MHLPTSSTPFLFQKEGILCGLYAVLENFILLDRTSSRQVKSLEVSPCRKFGVITIESLLADRSTKSPQSQLLETEE